MASWGRESELLIVAGGTGGEILELGKANPGWRFQGIDPSQPMLDLAKEKIAAAGLTERVALTKGFVEELPTDRVHDAAPVAMVMHFLRDDDGGKLKLLHNIGFHLKSGAPLVLIDMSMVI